MLPEEFNELSIQEKGELTFQKGTFIKALDTYSRRNKAVYGLNKLIVEVTFDNETNKILEIVAWENKLIKY
jgi:hypothetical protein